MSKKNDVSVPSHIRIGAFDYSVGPFTPMEGSKHGMLACHHGNDLEIQYQSDVKEQQLAHLLIHESMHGVFYTTGLHDKYDEGEEEELVTRISLSLAQIVRDNPGFFNWAHTALNANAPK